MANLAQLVNVIAPIRSEPNGPAWRQTTFHPFALTSAAARGDVFALQIDSAQLPTARSGEVDQIDGVATATDDELVLYLVNRSLDRVEPVTIDVGDGVLAVRSASTITPPEGGTRFTANTADLPEAVTPVPLTTTALEGSTLSVELPALSWSIVRLSLGAVSVGADA